MALTGHPTPTDMVVTCIKGEGRVLKFCAFPLSALEAINNIENHVLKIVNVLAQTPGFLNSSQIPPCFQGAAYSTRIRRWCRAQVLNAVSLSDVVVRLIDYGIIEQLSVSELRPIDENYFQMEPQAVECILADVVPSSEEWSPKAIRFCEQQLQFQKVSCFVVAQFMATPVVRIAKEGEKEPFVQRLINGGLAFIKPEASSHQLQPPVRPMESYKVNMLDPNATHLVKISFVESPLKFYVQLVAAEVELNKLMEEIRFYGIKENMLLNAPQVNVPCLTTFSNNPLKFYRGVIRAIMQNKYSVFSVDYGFHEVKDYKDLKPLLSRYLTLPAQAICCSLSQNDPNVKDFSRFANYELFNCHVLGHNNEAYIVQLFPHGQELTTRPPAPVTVKPQVFAYKYEKLKMNTAYDVTVSFTTDVSEFFCQLSHYKEQLDNISSILNSEINLQPITLPECVPNLPVCVRYSEDHIWYRARIEKVHDESNIEVFFVDFGNYDQSCIRDVCRMKADWMALPMQAHKCCLYGVDVPAESVQKDEMFELFEELATGPSLAAHVHSVTDEQSYVITLQDRNASISINEKLQSQFSTVSMVPVAEIEQLYITIFESPASFFGQFEKLSSKKLEEMQIEMNEFYANVPNSSFLPKIGSFVCAKYHMDNHFYRARVEKVAGSKCEVVFIDYGNRETIPIHNLHPLNKKFMTCPQFGVECGLENFPPATPVEKLRSLMLENSLRVQMIKMEKNKWTVALKEDFTGNVAILELLRQHESTVPRSIHGAGLRGFQEPAVRREVPSPPTNNEVRQSRKAFQSPNRSDSSRPLRMGSPVTRNRTFSPCKEERNDVQPYAMNFDVTFIPPKAFRNVNVSHVVSPSEFYCQIEEDSSKLEVLMKNMQDSYTNLNDNEMNLRDPRVGSPCCAMFQEDESWYRAQIKQVGPKMYTVYFVDFGNTDEVPVSKVKALQREFFNLPLQAIRCKSYNVSPKSGVWSDSDIETFMEWTLEKSLVAQFIESDSSGTYAVNLVSTDKLQEDVLNKDFVSLGHGRWEDATKATVLKSHIVAKSTTFPVPIIELGSLQNVTVTYGLNPGEIFCQLKSSENNFKKMMINLQEYYNSLSSNEALIDRPHQGMICVSQFSMDSAWYRGEILKVENNSVIVLYVDYGNSESTDRKKIRSITEDFTLLPIQGIKCHLKGIKPPGKSWPFDQNIGKYFEGDAQCRFIGKEGDSYIINLICNQENVAQKLVRDGLASSDIPIQKQEFPSETLQISKPQMRSAQSTLKRETDFVLGQLLSVGVSFIESPSKFWCQLLDESEVLEQLMADIECQYAEAGTLPVDAATLTPGAYCMAKYSADAAWYRAQVKSCLPAGEYEVFFIDYGNSEVTVFNELAAILPQFFKVPPLCFECHLQRAPATCGSEKTIEFQALMDEAEEITAKVESVTNGVYTVSLLFDKDGDEVNVSDLLFECVTEIVSSLIVDGPKFLPPDVPLGPQQGYVSLVNTPHDFFIQLASCEDVLSELSSELSETYEAATGMIHHPCVGYACCAKFSEDNNWYRAEIIGLQEKIADVLFVDYGNVSSVPKDSLKALNPKLLDIPPYAIRCKLNGITSPTDQWSEATVDSFQEMVLECPLGITFISKDIPALVNISKEDKDVAQSLIDLELAIIDTCPETEEAYADDHLTAVEDQLHSLPYGQSYPQRKLSSSKLPVKISYVDSYDKFYVTPQELSTELDTVMKTLEILYSPRVDDAQDSAKTAMPDILEDPSTSMACVAKCSVDEAFYRAIITDVEGESIYVSFVDYGNSEVSSLKNLRPLTPELIKIPPIAIECKLYAIQANEGKESEITAKLEEYFIDEVTLDMEIFKLSEPFEVRLYHQGEDLAEMLCQNGLTTEVIPPLESVKELEKVISTPPQDLKGLKIDLKENLKTAFVDIPEDSINSVPLRSHTENHELSVSVKHWETENDTIIIYGVPDDIDDELSSFQENLQDAYNKSNKKLSKINCSDYCVAKYLDDENWYRAQILSMDGDDIRVKFIDYGNSEKVKPEQVSELSPEFANIPQFSTEFCLSGFKVGENQKDLPDKIDDYLYSESVLVKLCKYRCRTPSTCITDILCGEVDVVEMLLAEKLILPQCIVNAQLGDKFEATVENIVEDLFYLLPVKFSKERVDLQTHLETICCDKSASVDEVDPCNLYATKIGDTWSRVYISSTDNDSKCAFAKCVDYGFEAEVRFDKLVLLPKDLWHRPLLLHECSISNFKDTSNIIQTKDIEKISACTFLCEIEKSYPLKYPLEVKIFEKDPDGSTETEQVYQANSTRFENHHIQSQDIGKEIEPEENLEVNDELNSTSVDPEGIVFRSEVGKNDVNNTESSLTEDDLAKGDAGDFDQIQEDLLSDFGKVEDPASDTGSFDFKSPEKSSAININDDQQPCVDFPESEVESVVFCSNTESTSNAAKEFNDSPIERVENTSVESVNGTVTVDHHSIEATGFCEEREGNNIEVGSHDKESSEVKELSAEDTECDERPECDIKQTEVENGEYTVVKEESFETGEGNFDVSGSCADTENGEYFVVEEEYYESNEGNMDVSVSCAENEKGGFLGVIKESFETREENTDVSGSCTNNENGESLGIEKESFETHEGNVDVSGSCADNEKGGSLGVEKESFETGERNIDVSGSCSDNEGAMGFKDSFINSEANEMNAKTFNVEFSRDLNVEQVPLTEASLTEESYSDTLIDVSQQQLSGKVDVYVSDIVISNGSVILSVIPYDLHVKLMSTLGESFQSIYSKKQFGLKHPSVSDLCAVFSDGTWFRGKILGVDGDKMELLLIDYGITKTVDRSLAVDLEPEHKLIPPYAVQCALASAYCPPEKSKEAKDFLLDLLANVQSTGKDVSIEVVEIGNPQPVNLFLIGDSVLFELLSQNFVIQTLPSAYVSSGEYSAKASHTYISDGKLHIHVNLVEQVDDLQRLKDSMNNSYPLKVGKASATESGTYAVLHRDAWVRGKAVSTGDELQLFLVDFGETISPKTDLFNLLPEHCIQPPYAIPCQIPVDTPGTDEILSALKDIFALREFLIKVDTDSESNNLTARVAEQELIEKIQGIAHLGQSI